MVSRHHASLKQYVIELEKHFIIVRDDPGEYTNQDRLNAVAFTLLASAQIEQYVENICSQAAKSAVIGLQKGKMSVAGRVLVIWHSIRNGAASFPVEDADVAQLTDRFISARQAYASTITKNHGISGQDLQRLVYPLGIKDDEIEAELIDKLTELADLRNPASHSRISGLRNVIEPKMIQARVARIIDLLEDLDTTIAGAC